MVTIKYVPLLLLSLLCACSPPQASVPQASNFAFRVDSDRAAVIARAYSSFYTESGKLPKDMDELKEYLPKEFALAELVPRGAVDLGMANCTFTLIDPAVVKEHIKGGELPSRIVVVHSVPPLTYEGGLSNLEGTLVGGVQWNGMKR